jgi:hypothetical protein
MNMGWGVITDVINLTVVPSIKHRAHNIELNEITGETHTLLNIVKPVLRGYLWHKEGWSFQTCIKWPSFGKRRVVL